MSQGWFIDDYSSGEAEAQAFQAANPAPQDEPVITEAMYDLGVYEGASGIDTTYGELLQRGTANSPSLVSDNMQRSGAGSPFSGVAQFLGSIGTVARDLGTAVGTIQRSAQQAPRQYEQARSAAVSGNKAQQWWQYSSTTDKLTVAIGLFGVYWLVSHSK